MNRRLALLSSIILTLAASHTRADFSAFFDWSPPAEQTYWIWTIGSGTGLQGPQFNPNAVHYNATARNISGYESLSSVCPILCGKDACP